MSDAGISGSFTNHCLRSTAISRMYNAGIPEKLISDKSGHHSLDGLRAYEHHSESMERNAEDSIAGIASLTAECKLETSIKSEGKSEPPEMPSALPSLPQFSGMNQCTINFNINYNSK